MIELNRECHAQRPKHSSIVPSRLQEAHQRVRELSTEDVERRLAHALLKLAREAGVAGKSGIEIDFPVNRQNLAEMIAATLHTVSRIMSAWEAAGILGGGRQRIAVCDESRLRMIAEGSEDSGA